MNRQLLIIACLFLALAAVPAGAAPPSSGASQAQVNGIDDRITNNLWAVTDEYFHHGDYPRSIACSRIVVSADSQYVEAYSDGAWLLESTGKLKEAEAYYQEGISKNPKSSFAAHQLGFFYFNTLKDYMSAVATFQRAAADPDCDVNDWKMLAHSYEHIDRYDLAVSTWQAIKNRWPQAPAVQVNLDRAQAKLDAQRASHV